MFCVTKVMDVGPMKIAKLAEGMVLPRTVEVRPFMWKIAGLSATGSVAFVVTGLSMWTAAACVLGWNAFRMLSSVAPLKGESLAAWASLAVSARLESVVVDGERVRVYIGTAPVGRLAAGPMTVVPTCAEVLPGAVDDLWGPLGDGAVPAEPDASSVSAPGPFRPVPPPGPAAPGLPPPPPAEKASY